MALTPICPSCGSAAVMDAIKQGGPVGSGLRLTCQRCHHTANNADFTNTDDWFEDEPDYRKSGGYLETRTIGLSDEA